MVKSYTTQTAWQAEHTYFVGMRLSKTHDADLIEHLEQADSKQGEVKRLMRKALEAEKSEQGRD